MSASFTAIIIPTLLLLSLTIPSLSDDHSKRGLIHISSEKPSDDSTLSTHPSSLSWYYNYGSKPTPSIAGLEYVPMLWGPPDQNLNFTADVLSLLANPSLSVRYVLGFNEPDMPRGVGGSDISPSHAAELWKRHIEPLADQPVKLGAPAIASTPAGQQWLEEFFKRCRDCSVDFIPLHWYGDFKGFASYLGQMRKTYPDKELWVTEIGFPYMNLAETYGFFNTSTEYLDRLDDVKRYAWFGSFRSDDSNVGPNAAMLDNNGALTDLGAWYLGRKATSNTPKSGSGRVVLGWGRLAMVLVMIGGVVV